MTEIVIGHWTKLGSAVREARVGRGWSQHELAERAEVSRSWVARLESGHRGAELEQILRLLAALDLTLTLRSDEPAGASDFTLRVATSSLVDAHESADAARRASWAQARPGPARA